MSEEPTYLSSNISTVKKPSFEVKKRSSPLEEHGDIRKPLKLVNELHGYQRHRLQGYILQYFYW